MLFAPEIGLSYYLLLHHGVLWTAGTRLLEKTQILGAFIVYSNSSIKYFPRLQAVGLLIALIAWEVYFVKYKKRRIRFVNRVQELQLCHILVADVSV